MELIDRSSAFVVALTADELGLLASCIGETLEAVDDWEFSTRLGVEPSVAIALQADVNRILASSRSRTKE